MFQKEKKPVAKGTVTFHGSLVEPDAKPRWLEVLQGLAITAGVLLVILVVFGVPYFRFDREIIQPKDGEELSTEHLAFTRYIGIGGAIDIRAGEFSEGLPKVVMVPLWRAFGDEPRQEI
jgi:hypothetical protein